MTVYVCPQIQSTIQNKFHTYTAMKILAILLAQKYFVLYQITVHILLYYVRVTAHPSKTCAYQWRSPGLPGWATRPPVGAK